MIVILFSAAFTHTLTSSGLGSVVVFATTIFALWKGVTNGSAAIVIVQAGIFAEASRQFVKFVPPSNLLRRTFA